MKLARLASKLYPRWWRERYGDEFAALLEDARPGVGGAIDIAKGALGMQLTSLSPRRVLAACLLLGIAGSAATLVALPRRFTSVAVVGHDPRFPRSDRTDFINEVNALAQSVVAKDAIAALIREYQLYGGETDSDVAIERFRRSTTLRPVKGENVEGFVISFDHADGAVAWRVTTELVYRFVDAQARATGREPTLKLFEPPTLPKKPSAPSGTRIFGTGIAASLFIGGVLALALKLLRRRLTAPAGTPPATPAI